MDDDQCNSGLVHQVFMGYGGLGSQGMCALASSFPDPTVHKQWEQDLIHYVRLHPFGQVDPPPYAFTYITFDDNRAAILRRVREGNSLGRNNGHALVGPASILGPLALRLTHTFRWAVRPEEMEQDPYPIERLREMVPPPRGVAHLDEARHFDLRKESACRIIGCVLANPDLNVSFIGLDHDLIIPILELFEGVLRPLFAVEPPIRRWTFSTYETGDADPGGSFRLPELVFLPVLPSHAGATCHHRIFLDDNVHVDDQYHQLAEKLVENYLKIGSGKYFRRAEGEFSSIETVASRIRHLLERLEHGSHGPSSHTRGSEALDQPRRSSIQHEVSVLGPVTGGHITPSDPRGASSPPGAPTPPDVPNPASVPNRLTPPVRELSQPVHVPADQRPQDWLSDRDLVGLLANAVTRPEANELIVLLCERIGSTPDKHRWRLVSHPDVLNSLARFFCPWELDTLYRRLLEFAFGADVKVLQLREFSPWIEDYILGRDADYFLGHTIFSLVAGSPAEAYYHNLLRRRWEKAHSIPLMVLHDTDRPHGRHRGGNLHELFRNQQLVIVVIVAILVILMTGIFVVTIFYT